MTQGWNKHHQAIRNVCVFNRTRQEMLHHPPPTHICLLPPANVVCEGYVFTGVCLSMGGSPIKEGDPLAGRPPGRETPLAGRPPGGRPSWRETPLAGRPPWQGDLLEGDPPGGRPPDRETPQQGDPPGRETPRRLLLRAVRILLECILVVYVRLILYISKNGTCLYQESERRLTRRWNGKHETRH